MLDRALSGRVTVVSAPPGSGKTFLLCSWLEQAEPGLREGRRFDPCPAHLIPRAASLSCSGAPGGRGCPQRGVAELAHFRIDKTRVASSVSDTKSSSFPSSVGLNSVHCWSLVDVLRTKLFGWGALPGAGPVTRQPSKPRSNEVEPSPLERSMSSTEAPFPWVPQSLT